VVEVSEKEYNKLKALGYGSDFETYTDRFIKKHPGHENKRPIIDDLHREKYAVLKKGKDGLCVKLDRQTMLCTIYNNRPKVCRAYKPTRCKKIRILK